MNARPHGIALVMVMKEYLDGERRKGAEYDTQNFISTFEHLQYSVRSYTKFTRSQMIQLVEEIVSMDHTAYDSFVCCIVAAGGNNHYVRCSDDKHVNVYELVDKIQQCSTLQGKPKIFLLTVIVKKVNMHLHLLHMRLVLIHLSCGQLKRDVLLVTHVLLDAILCFI